MAGLYLTQADMNNQLRGEETLDIIMFMPDKNIQFRTNSPVTTNTGYPLNYTVNIDSLINFSKPTINLATFENNSWLLNGTFISPSVAYGGGGDSYGGYIANDMTDENGDYTTNPILTVHLASVATKIEYITMQFAGGIDSSYPKQYKIRTYTSGGTVIAEHIYNTTEIDPESQEELFVQGLPMPVHSIMDQNVSKIEFELVGTVCPHRRVRLNKIMFGKAVQMDNYYLQSWSIEENVSLVSDSLPTKKFEFSLIDYEGAYDIDNPGTLVPDSYDGILILVTISVDVNGEQKYMKMKTFNLSEISTSADGLVTFTCGSVLDTMDVSYDCDVFAYNRPLGVVANQVLQLAGVSFDRIEYINNFGDYLIKVPVEEAPAKEVIQKLAFSCGATLKVNDDDRIIFDETNVAASASTPKFVFSMPDDPDDYSDAGILLEEPHAEALDHTKNIAMYTYYATPNYESTDGNGEKQLGSIKVSASDVGQWIRADIGANAGAHVDTSDFSEHHIRLGGQVCFSYYITFWIAWEDGYTPSQGEEVEIKFVGTALDIVKTLPRWATNDTLLLDSGLASTLPYNLKRPVNAPLGRAYYDDWYNAKFKYKLKTRGEFLIHAGDIILFETPYSNKQPNRVGYVLSNTYSDEDTGEMEVVMIGSND